MTKIKTVNLLLCTILLFAFLIRAFKIETIPGGIDWDEASFGYNAYSIAQTGMDEWGKFLPLSFQAFGDFKLPAFIYITSFFIRIFGLTVFSLRIVSALAGTLTVFFVYSIALIVFKDKRTALLSALFLALSPYGIFYSRLGLDISCIGMFIAGTVLYELKYIKDEKMLNLSISLLFLICCFFTYNVGRILAPFFLISIIAVSLHKKNTVHTVTVILLMIFMFGVGVYQLKNSYQSRMKYVGIFGTDKSMVLNINSLRYEDHNTFMSKLIHNKIVLLATTLTQKYVEHFSSNFLSSSNPPSAVQVSFHGPLFLIQLLFYYVGIVYLIATFLKEKNTTNKISFALLLFWMIISPFPSIITEGGISRRYIGALGTWEILCAFGVSTVFFTRKNRRYIWNTLFMVCALCYGGFAFQYLNFYFTKMPDFAYVYFKRQNDIAKYTAQEYANFDTIHVSRQITGEPHIFILFFLRFSPQKYIQTKNYTIENDWVLIHGFDKTHYPYIIDSKYLTTLKDDKKKSMMFLSEKEFMNLSQNDMNRFSYRKFDFSTVDNTSVYLITNK